MKTKKYRAGNYILTVTKEGNLYTCLFVNADTGDRVYQTNMTVYNFGDQDQDELFLMIARYAAVEAGMDTEDIKEEK